jgi:SAM-dependent methyltransferase
MKLSRDSVLQRAPDLTIKVSSPGSAVVVVHGRSVACGGHCLAVLDAFSSPVSVSDALAILGPRATSPLDWVDLMTTVERLREAGALLGPGEEPPALRATAMGLDWAPMHVAMLDDRIRTSHFVEGVRETVRPGDVVLDIGTGTGVLAIAAARAGAKHVYAVEVTRVARLARENFRANGLEDRITLVEGWSTAITLPERADVLVSELIGHDPLSENVVNVTADALRRHLKPGARLVPRRLDLYGIPLSMRKRDRERQIFTPAAVRRWRSWYGMDFSPMLEAAHGSQTLVTLPSGMVKTWKRLAEPVLVASVNLRTRKKPWLERRAVVTLAEHGTVDAFAIFFEVTIGPTVRYTTNPATADRRCHWGLPVWVLADALPLRAGDSLGVTYRYDEGGSSVRLRSSSQ